MTITILPSLLMSLESKKKNIRQILPYQYLIVHFCVTAEFYENGRCRPCHSTCEMCDGATEEACLTCSSPLVLQNSKCLAMCLDGSYMEQGVCTPCLHTCQRCVSRINCTSCVPGLHLQSGDCRATCADG